MSRETQKPFVKPDLKPLGNDSGELSDVELAKVAGGEYVLEGDCGTGGGDVFCHAGESATSICSSGAAGAASLGEPL